MKKFKMKPEYARAIQELRDLGCAVIVWNPEELDGADPDRVEERSVELGWEMLEFMK